MTFKEWLRKYIGPILCIFNYKFGKYKRNEFARHVFTICMEHKDYITARDIYLQYDIDEINRNLYLKLNDKEHDLLVRFFLKKFFWLPTSKEEEIIRINEVFKQVENIYKSNEDSPIVKFMYRDKEIAYIKKKKIEEGNADENILMNYYEVAHAFFFEEYRLDGFNPIDGQTILDCGAASGDTMIMFRVLYPNSKIISFETEQDNINRCHKNMEMNGIDNIEIVQGFLYKDSKEHKMDPLCFTIDGDADTHTVNIKTLSIDDYVKTNHIDNIGLIKLDIEGGEQNALWGAIDTIRKQKPLLYIPIYHLRDDIIEIPRFLYQLGLDMSFGLKWTERKVWGVDCVLFVRFND